MNSTNKKLIIAFLELEKEDYKGEEDKIGCDKRKDKILEIIDKNPHHFVTLNSYTNLGLFLRSVGIVGYGSDSLVFTLGPTPEGLKVEERIFMQGSSKIIYSKDMGSWTPLGMEDEQDETDKCYLEYEEEGSLSCSYNHTPGAICLMNCRD